jgi:hypothetical protein
MTIDVDYDRVESLAGQGLSKSEIAYCLGIGVSTLYEKQKKNPDFMDAIKRGKAKGLETVTNALMSNAQDGNVTAQIFYLKNRSPERWQDRRNTEVTGKGGGPIGILPFEFVDAEHTETPKED